MLCCLFFIYLFNCLFIIIIIIIYVNHISNNWYSLRCSCYDIATVADMALKIIKQQT